MQKYIYLFVDYVDSDKLLYMKIHNHLKIIGSDILLLHEDDVIIGADKDAIIAENIKRSALFIPLFSAEYLADDAKMERLSQQLSEGKKIIPILVRQCLWEELLPVFKSALLPHTKTAPNFHNPHEADWTCTEISKHILSICRGQSNSNVQANIPNKTFEESDTIQYANIALKIYNSLSKRYPEKFKYLLALPYPFSESFICLFLGDDCYSYLKRIPSFFVKMDDEVNLQQVDSGLKDYFLKIINKEKIINQEIIDRLILTTFNENCIDADIVNVLTILTNYYDATHCKSIEIHLCNLFCKISFFTTKSLKKLMPIVCSLEKHIDSFSTLQNEIKSSTYHQLACANMQIGKLDISLSYCEKAISLLKKDYRQICKYYLTMGDIYYGMNMYNMAEKYYADAETVLTPIGDNDLLQAHLLLHKGRLLQTTSNTTKEIDGVFLLYNRVTEICQKQVTESTYAKYIESVVYLLMGVLYNNSDLDKSLNYYLRSLHLKEHIFGKNHLSTAHAYHNIGNYYFGKNDLDDALSYYLKAHQIRSYQLGDKNLHTLKVWQNIAKIYQLKEDTDSALSIYNTIIDLVDAKSYRDYCIVLMEKSKILSKKNQLDEAINLLKQSIDIATKYFGNDSPNILHAFHDIGVIYISKKDYVTALDILQKVLSMKKQKLGSNSPYTADTSFQIAIIHAQTNQIEKAITLLQEVADIRESKLGLSHIDTGLAYMHLGDNCKKLSSIDKAILAYKKAINSLDYPKNHSLYYDSLLLSYANLLDLQIKTKGATDKEALETLSKILAKIQAEPQYQKLLLDFFIQNNTFSIEIIQQIPAEISYNSVFLEKINNLLMENNETHKGKNETNTSKASRETMEYLINLLNT